MMISKFDQLTINMESLLFYHFKALIYSVTFILISPEESNVKEPKHFAFLITFNTTG